MNAPAGNPRTRTDAEWRRILTQKQYEVLRLGHTEPPFSGAYCYHKAKGTYRCAGCGAALFSSQAKYDSGSGWPSFNMPIHPSVLRMRVDYSHGMMRVEIRCAQCGGHLGHVFNDGPPPTGLRYCVNSVALEFEPSEASEGADSSEGTSAGGTGGIGGDSSD